MLHFRTFLLLQKETLYPLAVTPPIGPYPQPPAIFLCKVSTLILSKITSRHICRFTENSRRLLYVVLLYYI